MPGIINGCEAVEHSKSAAIGIELENRPAAAHSSRTCRAIEGFTIQDQTSVRHLAVAVREGFNHGICATVGIDFKYCSVQKPASAVTILCRAVEHVLPQNELIRVHPISIRRAVQ